MDNLLTFIEKYHKFVILYARNRALQGCNPPAAYGVGFGIKSKIKAGKTAFFIAFLLSNIHKNKTIGNKILHCNTILQH